MADHLRDGFVGTCTSPASGTGAYTNVVSVPGARPFSSLADGDTVTIAVRSANGWGEDVYATKSGGATPTLNRTRILSNSNGNTSPIDWPTGTPLFIYSAVSGVEIASLIAENDWEADQSFQGHKLRLSPDGETHIAAVANDLLEMTVDNAQHTLLGKGASNESYILTRWSDNGAVQGPFLSLDRQSASPAVNDYMGFVNFSGRNQSGQVINYAAIFSRIKTATAAAEDGALEFRIFRAGAGVYCGEVNGHYWLLFPQYQEPGTGVLIGKAASNLANVGIELLSSGQIGVTSNNVDPVNINRNGGDGNIIAVYRDNIFKRAIRIDAGVLSFSGALYTHPTRLQGRPEGETHPVGTVLCSVDDLLDDGDEIHPLARVSTRAADPCVYGVWWAREEETGYLLVGGGGSGLIRVIGPVAHGDLLETSDIPGVARAQIARPRWWQFWRRARPDRMIRASTVAKARGSVPAGLERTIPCTLKAG